MQKTKRSILSILILCVVILIATTVVKTQTGVGHNHVVSLATAEKYVKNFRNNPTVPQIQGGLFNRNVIDAILAQADCAAIRYYYAKKDDGSATLVIVGVNSAGADIESGVIAEEILPCPPVCGVIGTLNR